MSPAAVPPAPELPAIGHAAGSARSRSQLLDAVVQAEARIQMRVRENFRLESLIATKLLPELERRRRELRRLERRLASMPRTPSG